jgi:hypothetical protein
MHIGFHVKYPLFLSDFNESRIFSIDIRKIIKFKISLKYLPNFASDIIYNLCQHIKTWKLQTAQPQEPEISASFR